VKAVIANRKSSISTKPEKEKDLNFRHYDIETFRHSEFQLSAFQFSTIRVHPCNPWLKEFDRSESENE